MVAVGFVIYMHVHPEPVSFTLSLVSEVGVCSSSKALWEA